MHMHIYCITKNFCDKKLSRILEYCENFFVKFPVTYMCLLTLCPFAKFCVRKFLVTKVFSYTVHFMQNNQFLFLSPNVCKMYCLLPFFPPFNSTLSSLSLFPLSPSRGPRGSTGATLSRLPHKVCSGRLLFQGDFQNVLHH